MAIVEKITGKKKSGETEEEAGIGNLKRTRTIVPSMPLSRVGLMLLLLIPAVILLVSAGL